MIRLSIAILCLATVAQAATPQITPEQQQACMGDYMSFCPAVIPGGGRIIACLRKYGDKVSPSCRAAIREVDLKR